MLAAAATDLLQSNESSKIQPKPLYLPGCGVGGGAGGWKEGFQARSHGSLTLVPVGVIKVKPLPQFKDLGQRWSKTVT